MAVGHSNGGGPLERHNIDGPCVEAKLDLPASDVLRPQSIVLGGLVRANDVDIARRWRAVTPSWIEPAYFAGKLLVPRVGGCLRLPLQN